MKNKKGFTLIELLAVLVVLSITLLIGSSSITKIIKNNKQKAYDLQNISFQESAKLWAYDNNNNLPGNNEYAYIKISQLKQLGYVDKNIKNALTGADYASNTGVCVENKNGIYKYTYTEDGNCNTDLQLAMQCFNISFDTINQYYNYMGGDQMYSNASCPKDAVLPTSYNGVQLTKVASNAFYLKKLTSVTIPSGYVSIADYAFFGNYLTSVDIPDTVTTLGKHAFSDNLISNLKLSNSISVIPEYAFENNKIESITLPIVTTRIEIFAFQSNKIQSLILPDSVEFLGERSFENNNITSVSISSKVTTLGDYAFKFNLLKSINVPDNVTSMGDYLFSNNQISSYTLPSNITVIPNSLFRANNLTEVTIPSTVKIIGPYSFATNDSLTSITIPDSVEEIGNHAFSEDAITELVIPPKVKKISDGLAYYCRSLTTVTIQGLLTSIGDYAFYNSTLTSIDLPNSLTSIGSYAFYNTKMESIVLPPLLKSIQISTFESCGQLNSITLNEGLETIDKLAFRYCYKLASITLPNKLKSINSYAFSYAPLLSLDIPNSVSYISDYAFAYCTSIKTINVDNFSNTIGGGTAPWGADKATVTYAKTLTYDSSVTGLAVARTTKDESNYTLYFNSTDVTKIVTSVTANGVTYDDYKITTSDDTLNVTAYTTDTANSVTFETANPAGVNLDGTVEGTSLWYVSIPSAKSLEMSFTSESNLKKDVDHIYIYNKDGNLIGDYSTFFSPSDHYLIPYTDYVIVKLVTGPNSTTTYLKGTFTKDE